MSIFKKKLDEQLAANSFVLAVIKETKERWPGIYQVLREGVNGEYFIVEDEEGAQYNLALAGIAQGLQAVKNLFTKEQAERFELFILKVMANNSEYAVEEIKEYGSQFQNAILNIKDGAHPEEAIPTRLLQRWLGSNIKYFYVEINGKKTEIISPILVMEVGVIMATFPKNWSWKQVSANYKLIKGDLPLSEI